MLNTLHAALRSILAVILVGGAAIVIVAPAFDMAASRAQSRAASANAAPQRNHPSATPEPTDDPDGIDASAPEPTPKVDFEALLRACLETRDADSTDCARAQEHSGISFEAFRAKIVATLETPRPDPTKKPEPIVTKPEPAATKKPQTPSFDTLLNACLETRDEQSDQCVRAGEASGSSQADWDATIRSKLDAARQADFATYFEKCLATRDINSDICFRAEQLSGLSREDFDAKFAAKLAARDGNDFGTWFDKCLASRDVRSDACARAQQLIGFNDADFHAKFDRYLAERDAAAAKTNPTPKPTTRSLETLVKSCGATRSRMSEACLAALVASGLQPTDFWAKVESLFGHFD